MILKCVGRNRKFLDQCGQIAGTYFTQRTVTCALRVATFGGPRPAGLGQGQAGHGQACEHRGSRQRAAAAAQQTDSHRVVACHDELPSDAVAWRRGLCEDVTAQRRTQCASSFSRYLVVSKWHGLTCAHTRQKPAAYSMSSTAARRATGLAHSATPPGANGARVLPEGLKI